MTSQLDDRSLALVKDVLQDIGYDNHAIVADYDFAAPGDQHDLGHVDLAAFSDPIRHDLYTSCIAAQRIGVEATQQATLERLSYLAMPVALMLKDESVEIWSVKRGGISESLADVPYHRLAQFFAEHIEDLSPDALSNAKTRGRQLSFFDLDQTLLEFAYDSTQKILVQRFESAVRASKESYGKVANMMTGDFTKAALQILAAAILEDKQLLGNSRASNVRDLIQLSARHYGQYFQMDWLDQIGENVAQVTFETLRRNITFRSFTNEMLGYFYENAFIDKKLRKELGVYYTPRSIARRMLARLPIEDIPPGERVVFDGSSGSGNLLLAAFERLENLLPSRWSRSLKHDYLVQRLHGVDVDQFATQVAGLSLFFIDLPAGDAWNVRTADFMSYESSMLPRSPTILVGNPPFRETRSWKGKRRQDASRFLNKYLDLMGPGGLLGIVLPETFLENSSCLDARRRLFKECEILELWHLPEGMFPMSNVATIIVLAKKLPERQNNPPGPIRVERVASRSPERKQYLKGERPRYSYVVQSMNKWVHEPYGRLCASPLEKSVWNVIRAPNKLRDVASIRNGIIPGSNQRTTHFACSDRNDGGRPWLRGASDIEPYALKPRELRYIRYPGNLHRPRIDLERLFETPKTKVFVNSGRAPGNPWRIYAAIDDYGYFPSQGLHCVIPKDGSVSLEELVAFLNSSIASAWIDSRNRKRWIDERTLGDMPFPSFDDRIRELIVARVAKIMALKAGALVGSPRHGVYASEVRRLALSIDELIYDALGLGEEGQASLNELFAGYRRPGREWIGYNSPIEEVNTRSNSRKWPVTGQVLDVDPEENTATMWVRGYCDSQPFQMSIPEDMPGWALRPDAAFEAEIPWESRNANMPSASQMTSFKPLDFSYVQLEDLLKVLDNPEQLNEFYGR